MFIIHGRKVGRIGKFIDNHHYCRSCQAMDLEVRVYKPYFHLFFLPIFPLGDRTVKIYCRNCGEPMRLDAISKVYEPRGRPPFYFFSGLILLAGLIAWGVVSNGNTQKEKARFVAAPAVGDVYSMEKHDTKLPAYYFLRIKRISGDSLILYHSHLEYSGIVSQLAATDYFERDDTLLMMKDGAKRMLEKEEIDAVHRGYGHDEGFNRIK